MNRKVLDFSGSILVCGMLWVAQPVPAQMRGGSPPPPSSMEQGGGMNQPGGSMNMRDGTAAMQNDAQSAERNAFLNIKRNIDVENKLSKLALKHSENADIRKFAQQVIADNRKIENQLVLPPPEEMMGMVNEVPAATRKAEKQMKKLTGKPFDQVYLVQMDAYVRNDQQVGQNISAMMHSQTAKVGSQILSVANDRIKQIAELTTGEGFKIE